MFVLDTNGISELRKPRPHGAVAQWFRACDPSTIYLPAPCIGEIQAGIEKTRSTDPAKATEIESWLDDVLRMLQILDMTGDAFRTWARFMHRKPAHLAIDAMIAASAATRRFVIVTRNVGDFEPFGVSTLNPFETG